MTLTWWAALVLAGPVQISDTTPGGCIPEGTETALMDVTKKVSLVTEVTTSGEDPVIITVRILEPTGKQIQSRDYPVKRADCGNSDRLLALVVQVALDELPLEEWIVFEQEDPPPVTEITSYGFASAGSRMFPFGAEVQAGGGRGFKPESPWFVTYMVRAGWPNQLGGGRVQETSGLFGIARTFPIGRFENQLEVRGGGILLTGLGYDSNQRAILPWGELAWTTGHEFKGLWLGAELAASPIQHRVLTTGTDANQSLALVRLGLVMRLGSTGPKK